MSKSCIFLLLSYLLLPLAVAAQCGQWDVSGTWNVWLGDSKTAERLTLSQAGTKISGSAHTDGPVIYSFEGIEVKGTVTGDKVRFVIDRNRSALLGGLSVTEGFEGTFGQDGRITGQASIFALAGLVKVDWTSDRPMKCLRKTVGSLGVKHSEPRGDTGPGPMKAPWIVAAPNNIPARLAGTSLTTLNWDAGKDHPYAEVWVKVDGQDERKIIELGKGTIQQPVVPGRTYLYILTDYGKTLATVTVRFSQ